MITDQQEAFLITNALIAHGFTQVDVTRQGIATFKSRSERFAVYPDAGWTHFQGTHVVKAAGNGISNLRKHLRADRAGYRSDWSI